MLFISLILGKITLFFNRLTGSGGSAMPGLAVEKINSNFIEFLAVKNFPKGVILITGTNGKTTTSKMIAGILDKAGISYLHNRAGSNLPRGIASAMIGASSILGKIKADIGLFEVDEAAIPKLTLMLQPKIILVTNLFRDQLDRYGELDKTARLFKQAFEQSNAAICLNSDDPLVAGLSLGLSKKHISFYGVSDYPDQLLDDLHSIDVTTSPVSSSKLVYSKRYFGHVGIYETENQDFKRPKPDVELVKLKKSDINRSEFIIKINETLEKINLPLAGLYNIYNSLAATAVASKLGIRGKIIIDTLNHISPAFGRMEIIKYYDRNLYLLLIKNPTGLNQIIQTFLLKKPNTPVLIIINDNIADGRDVSWLWDSAVEAISKNKGPMLVSGIRAYDMGLRLKYAGVKNFLIEPDINLALRKIVEITPKNKPAFILPTYTAMLNIRAKIVKKSEAKEFWK
ncbi:MAG: MurT ligase domain-containing protein [bacterium]|nr:MurT ligase domain-containing protein [bacterium]